MPRPLTPAAPDSSLPALLDLKLQSRIYEVRGVLVMLDSDLAELYGVETRSLNQVVSRNRERFPEDFMFQLTSAEAESLRSQIVISNEPLQIRESALRSQTVTSNVAEGRGGRRYRPYVFTQQGVAMLSGVLRSERAVQVNIAIMRAFVELRRWVRGHEDLARRLAALERQSDAQYRQVMEVLERLVVTAESKKRIGFRKASARRHNETAKG